MKLIYTCKGIVLALALAAIMGTVSQTQDLPLKSVSGQPWGQLRTAAPSLWAESVVEPNGRLTFRPTSWFVAIPLDALASKLADAMQKYNRGALPATRVSTLRTGALELSSSLADFHAGSADEVKA